MRLTKEELANEIREKLLEKLPEGSEVDVREVTSSHGTYTGICANIPSEGPQSISPVINVDAIFAQYEMNGIAEDAIEDAVRIFEENRSPEVIEAFTRQISAVNSFEEASRLMYLSVLPPAVESDLESIPHKDIEDIHLGVKLLMTSTDDNIATVTVKNNLMHSWNVSEEELFKAAEENTLRIRPTQMAPMFDILSAMMPEGTMPELTEGIENMRSKKLNMSEDKRKGNMKENPVTLVVVVFFEMLPRQPLVAL